MGHLSLKPMAFTTSCDLAIQAEDDNGNVYLCAPSSRTNVLLEFKAFCVLCMEVEDQLTMALPGWQSAKEFLTDCSKQYVKVMTPK